MRRWENIVISRSVLNPSLEVYMDGELLGRMTFEPRGSGSVRVRISATPALRFVKDEYSEKTKLAHIHGAAGAKSKQSNNRS